MIQQFCWGQWTEPPSPPTVLAAYQQRLRALYDWRTDADYAARMLMPSEARDGLTLTEEILAVVAQVKGLRLPYSNVHEGVLHGNDAIGSTGPPNRGHRRGGIG